MATDWKLLREQKEHLVEILMDEDEIIRLRYSPAHKASLDGILHLIDGLQDEAACKIGYTAVFGEEEDSEKIASKGRRT